jgi:hypothetical protein
MAQLESEAVSLHASDASDNSRPSRLLLQQVKVAWCILPLLEMSCDNWWTVKSTPLTAGGTAKPSSKRLSWKQPLDRRLPCCNWASTEGIPGMWE